MKVWKFSSIAYSCLFLSSSWKTPTVYKWYAMLGSVFFILLHFLSVKIGHLSWTISSFVDYFWQLKYPRKSLWRYFSFNYYTFQFIIYLFCLYLFILSMWWFSVFTFCCHYANKMSLLAVWTYLKSSSSKYNTWTCSEGVHSSSPLPIYGSCALVSLYASLYFCWRLTS